MSKRRAVLLIVLLFALMVSGLAIVETARANPWHFVDFGPPLQGTTPPQIAISSPQNSDQQNPPQIAMPVEYVNYHVFTVNGDVWAAVDGTYPMQVSQALVGQELQMVYPTPPGTTNISLALNEHGIGFSNLTASEPYMMHYTYLGVWSMILFSFEPPSPNFTLTIHYQHPVPEMNGSYTFLYDLNIGTYLSNTSSQSTAHFNIAFPSGCRDICVYSVPGDSSPSRGNAKTPINFTTSKDNGVETVTFDVVSGYSLPLPGDELVTFQAPEMAVPEFQVWAILLSLLAAAAVLAICKKRLC